MGVVGIGGRYSGTTRTVRQGGTITGTCVEAVEGKLVKFGRENA